MKSLTFETKEKIRQWLVRVEDVDDYFVKFFICYMCFDAWMTSLSQFDLDKEKIYWLKTSDNKLRLNWDKIKGLDTIINELKNIGPVSDMRPNNPKPDCRLNVVVDFSNLFDYVYQIRCNLFHGSKASNDTKDRQLVRLSADIVELWVDLILDKNAEIIL